MLWKSPLGYDISKSCSPHRHWIFSVLLDIIEIHGHDKIQSGYISSNSNSPNGSTGKYVTHWMTCSWGIACQRYSNYIFILDFTTGFNVLGKSNCKTIQDSFKFCDLVSYIRKFTIYTCISLAPCLDGSLRVLLSNVFKLKLSRIVICLIGPWQMWLQYRIHNFQIEMYFNEYVLRIYSEIAFKRMPLDIIDDWPILVQMMACCLMKPSCYLKQFWSNLITPYGVIRDQWVNLCWLRLSFFQEWA